MITVAIPAIITGDTPKFTFKVYRVSIEYSEDPPAEISDVPFSLTGATLSLVGRATVDGAVVFTKTPVVTAILESGVANECEIQMLPADFAALGSIYMELEVSRPDLNFVGTPIRLKAMVQQGVVR